MAQMLHRFFIAALSFPLIFGSISAAEPNKTILIRDATLYDGSGKPGKVANILLDQDRISQIGEFPIPSDCQIIDAKGWIVCPGFIDLHTHCDYGILSKSGKTNKNYITQGCTTVITGNCGSGPVDVGDYFKKLEAQGIATNEIHLAPHNSIREKVMGNANRAPTPEEQAKMESLVRQAMNDGAFGMATGLIYNPGTYSKTAEIIGLAKVIGEFDGLYASHIRDEAAGLLIAIEEAMTIGTEGKCRVHISHIKASGRGNWGASIRAVKLIENARQKGQKITADQYPYIASSTSLRATVIPAKYREGSDKDLVARLNDPKTGPAIRADIAKQIESDNGARIQIARYAKQPKWQGKNIAAIATETGKTPVEVIVEIESNGGAQIVNFGMSEEDVRVYMKQPWVATASDGGVQTPGATVPHPRNYGTFPRKIGKYALEDNIVSLEFAIRASTGLPADILQLKDRGYLKKGYFADIVIFDPKTFRDTATFEKPHQYASGVKWVFVNGQAVIADEQHQAEILPGKVLRHPVKAAK